MSRFKTYRRMFLSAALLMVAALALPIASQATKAAPTPKAPKLPSAATGGAAQVTYSTATLNATVNPHGTETAYYFQYGSTAAYGAQTTPASVGSGTVEAHLNQAISGLQIGSAYHYRVVAVSSAGTTLGQDRVFTTKSVALKFEVPKTPRLAVFGTPVSIAGSLTGTGGPNHEVVLQANQFPFLGGFKNLGSPQATNAAGAFAFQVSGLSQNTQLRVMTMDTRPVYSPVVSVRVAVRVILHANVTRRKGYERLYGTVAPAEAGASVAFQLLRAGRGAQTMGGTTVKKSASGVASFSSVVLIPHGHGGFYRAFVKVTDGSHAPGYSRAVLVHSAPAVVHVHHSHRRSIS